jgi:hypothetical protein
MIPDQYMSESGYHSEQHPLEPSPVAIVWPDNNFPPGFMPLSPIPTLTNFNPADHDHHRMHEQFRGAGYQIYAGAALAPPVAGIGMTPRTSTFQNPNSVLFSELEPPRPSTAAGITPNPPAQDVARRRVMSFGISPAPLNRPLSIFSDT